MDLAYRELRPHQLTEREGVRFRAATPMDRGMMSRWSYARMAKSIKLIVVIILLKIIICHVIRTLVPNVLCVSPFFGSAFEEIGPRDANFCSLEISGRQTCGGKKGESIMVRDMTIRVLMNGSSSARRQLFELEFAKFAIGRRCAARANANRAAGCLPVDGLPVTARDSNATKLACARWCNSLAPMH